MNKTDDGVCVDSETKQVSQFSNLYKTSGKTYTQAERRNKLLSEVKKRRSDAVDEVRGIADIFQDEEHIDEEPIDVVSHNKRKKNYSRKIMLSEWFADIPLDLEENWIYKLCPTGVRNIVIANNGITKVFNRHNQKKAEFVSNLPGGGSSTNGRHFTILDCIFNYTERTYYVLDVLAWNSCSLLKCSAEFRFYFLKIKLEENPELQSDSSKLRFVNVNYASAQLPNIEAVLSEPHTINDASVSVDGVLFYHKEADYAAGPTPLVGWLKPYMIPEMLQIPVHEVYMIKKPENYTSLPQYLEFVKSKCKRKPKMNKEEAPHEMETEGSEDADNCDEMEN